MASHDDVIAPFPEAALRHHAWLAVLVMAVSGLSFVFACATPFAAFGVLAAITLSRRDAIRVTVALWLVNQVVGYVVLGYPRTANSVAWGLAIGVAAITSTVVSRRIAARLGMARGLTQAVAAFGGAFAAYELLLYAFAVAGLGGTGSFAAPIVVRILVVNAAALVGLFALHRLAAVTGIVRHAAPAAAAARPVTS